MRFGLRRIEVQTGSTGSSNGEARHANFICICHKSIPSRREARTARFATTLGEEGENQWGITEAPKYLDRLQLGVRTSPALL